MPRPRVRRALRRLARSSRRGFGGTSGLGGAPIREVTWFPRQIQPVPNSFNTTLVHSSYGWASSGTANANYGMAYNYLVAPFGSKGGASNGFANNTGGDPVGLLNFLSNTITNTGFYVRCVVRRSRILLSFNPGALTDTVVVAAGIVQNASVQYASLSQAMDAPNVITKTISSGMNRDSNTLSLDIRPHLIAGLSPSLWKVSGSFSYASAPNFNFFLQVFWQTPAGTNLSANLPWTIRLEHDVTFYLRNDTTLNA